MKQGRVWYLIHIFLIAFLLLVPFPFATLVFSSWQIFIPLAAIWAFLLFLQVKNQQIDGKGPSIADFLLGTLIWFPLLFWYDLSSIRSFSCDVLDRITQAIAGTTCSTGDGLALLFSASTTEAYTKRAVFFVFLVVFSLITGYVLRRSVKSDNKKYNLLILVGWVLSIVLGIGIALIVRRIAVY